MAKDKSVDDWSELKNWRLIVENESRGLGHSLCAIRVTKIKCFTEIWYRVNCSQISLAKFGTLDWSCPWLVWLAGATRFDWFVQKSRHKPTSKSRRKFNYYKFRYQNKMININIVKYQIDNYKMNVAFTSGPVRCGQGEGIFSNGQCVKMVKLRWIWLWKKWRITCDWSVLVQQYLNESRLSICVYNL